MALDQTPTFKETVKEAQEEEKRIREEFKIPDSFRLHFANPDGTFIFTRLDEDIIIQPDGVAMKTWWGPRGTVTKPWEPTT